MPHPTLSPAEERTGRTYSNWTELLFSLGLLTAAFFLRFRLAPHLGSDFPFIFFAPAAILSTWFAGIEHGLLVLTAGAFLGHFFFTRIGDAASVAESAQLMAYFIPTLIACAVIEILRRSKRRALNDYHDLKVTEEKLRTEIANHEESRRRLAQSEELFRLAAKTATDAIYQWDIQSGRILWNDGLSTLFGHSSESINHDIDWWENSIHPDDRRQASMDLHRVIERKEHQWMADYRFRRANGSYAFVTDRGFIAYNEQNQPITMVGAMSDITRRIEVHQQLARQKKHQEMLLYATTYLLHTHSASELLNVICPKLNEGFSLDVCCCRLVNGTNGKSHFQFCPGAARDGIEQLLQNQHLNALEWAAAKENRCLEISASHAPDIAALEAIKASGLQSFCSYPLLVEQNTFGWLVVASRIRTSLEPDELSVLQALSNSFAIALNNSRLQAELNSRIRQLSESETRFRQLADAMPQKIWSTNAEGEIDYFNGRWMECAPSLRPDQWDWSEFVHPDEAAKAKAAWINSIREQTNFEIELRLKGHDGSYRWHLARAIFFRNPGEIASRWYGTCTDIHDHKTAEQDLEAAKARLNDYAQELEQKVHQRTSELQESLQSLEGFCYSIAHDLRAPLRAMQGLSQALLEDHSPKLDASGRDLLDRIAKSAAHMDQLVVDLLEYGWLTHGKLQQSALRPNEQIDHLLASMMPEISSKSAHLSIQPNMPSIWANQIVFRQVMTNLISNALKFVRPGTPPILNIYGTDTESTVRIHVEDNGIGIAPQFQEKIFQVFQRLHRPEEYPGTGIGLAIVKKGVERMGGRVGLNSVPDNGSCFWIELPKPPSG